MNGSRRLDIPPGVLDAPGSERHPPPWWPPIGEVSVDISDCARDRILILDGAWGTMLQRAELTEDDFRFDGADPERAYRGNFDLLQLTRPDVIADVHAAYVEAGADIASTNTFNANVISQADYGTEHLVRDMNLAAARIAREVIDAAIARDGRPRWVAGSVGPTNRTASLSPDVERPGFRAVTFTQLADAYTEQVVALLEGGADLILIETVFDTLNAKAALFACEEAFAVVGRRAPIMLSGTITDASGRTLSGQTPEAFAISTAHADLFSVGLNCALGPDLLRPHLRELAESAGTALVSAHPNAGLPNAFGEYEETPEQMAEVLGEFARAGLLNVVGGCCGTTPEHIRAIADAVAGVPPRAAEPREPRLRLSGLDPFTLTDEIAFVNVGERTNIAGSPRFAKAMVAGDDDAAVAIAAQQVAGGAQIVDVNVDDAMLDGPEVMGRFLNLLAAEPAIARVPVMIDSSDWAVLETGLQRVQGKAVVNSLSLKDGEATFLERARRIQRYGAAVVVMAFDEQGQADTLERRTQVCERAYRLLTEQAGYAPQDIIFDPNVLTVATGMSEHDRYAVDFIEAVRWIKQNLPGALTSGGISNVSFSFRGNNHVREAMHAVFLRHAIEAGLDMGIVNAGMLTVEADLDPALREAVEDVILARRADATERLIALADSYKAVAKDAPAAQAWRDAPVADRLRHALVHGVVDHVAADAEEAFRELGSPLAVIEGPLMAGMDEVGDLFGAGRMFLPQVVKSARVMKAAVAQLTPHLEAEKAAVEAAGGTSRGKGTVVLATVKGDVHDIGKNIVGVVLACNGYEVHDLGVMVPAEKILAAADELGADVLGVSGLITPSLHEMVSLAAEMERRGLRRPLMIGGATTSRAHTAVKIAPAYGGSVVHVQDASRAVGVVSELLSDPEALATRTATEYAELRERHGEKDHKLVPLAEARARATRLDPPTAPAPKEPGRHVLEPSIAELAEVIDWTPLFTGWELRGTYPRILDDPRQGEQARSLFADARALLDVIVAGDHLHARGVAAVWPARRVGDDIAIYTSGLPAGGAPGTPDAVLHTLRQQRERAGDYTALADYVALAGDHVGGFAVGIHGAEELARTYDAAGDDFTGLLVKTLADRLAEAFAEWLHRKVRTEIWGYAPDEALPVDELIKERYAGIRPAPGYPAQPDHTEKATIFALLRPEEVGIELTESWAMTPPSAVSGLYLAHPGARYFAVGKIGADQVADYAERKGWTLAEAEHWLAPNLGYTPA